MLRLDENAAIFSYELLPISADKLACRLRLRFSGAAAEDWPDH